MPVPAHSPSPAAYPAASHSEGCSPIRFLWQASPEAVQNKDHRRPVPPAVWPPYGFLRPASLSVSLVPVKTPPAVRRTA